MIRRDDYFALAHERPELFTNPDGEIITILLDEEEIKQAEEVVAAKLSQRNLPADWAQVGIAYQDQYLLMLRDAVRFPGGALGTYIRAVAPSGGAPGVIAIPVYQGQVVLLRHFRHGTRSWNWEIPRGFGEPGSTPEQNARRELEEEIGATVTRVVSLGTVTLDTDSSGPPDGYFLAEISAYTQAELEEGISALRLVSFADFERMIREGEISEGYTLAAYARAKALGLM